MAGIIQIAGAVITSIGVGMIFVPAGIVLAGVLTIVFGVAMERDNAE
jgi:hypothetical protein